ncbi:hypothetical protein BGX34_005289 [Mortierella sp. NVP85]|nr:hypothetical protein BGX34_005289 [Mortierella sp. NVP85]
MKIAIYSFTAGAVALSATALGFPTMYKRAIEQTKALACAAESIVSGVVTPHCSNVAAMDVGAIREVWVEDMIVDFLSGDVHTMDISSSRFFSNLLPVPGVKWAKTESTQRVTVVDNGNPIATFNTPSSPGTVTGSSYVGVVNKCPLKINPGQEENFVAFMVAILTKPEHTYSIRGDIHASLQVNIPFTDLQTSLTTPRIAFDSPVTLKGFNSFPKVDFVKLDDFAFDPATGVYTLTATINIHNLSQFVLSLGEIIFRVADKTGSVVGLATVKDMKLKMGDNHVTGIVTGTSKEMYDTLTTTGDTIIFQGFDGSSPNPILAKSLTPLRVPMYVPPLSPPKA